MPFEQRDKELAAIGASIGEAAHALTEPVGPPPQPVGAG